MTDPRPVLILQNQSADGPGHLASWLTAHGIGFEVFDAEAGARYPTSVVGYRALALLGGEMSANDDLPALRQAERLLLEAIGADIPVLGHCLGGQLMARALGARVHAASQPEIGWQPIKIRPSPAARHWLGEAAAIDVFQWHGEAFELPTGATRLASSRTCPNQAFAIGPHLALQFHLELDADKLARWSASVDPAYLRQQRFDTVQTGPAMRASGATRLAAQQQLADRVYRRWLGRA